ncbi:MAG: VOC family protein [Cyanobacteria bacterium P01_F01_bin.3]
MTASKIESFREVFVALSSHQVEKQMAFYKACFSVEPTVSTSSYCEFRLAGLKLAIFEPSATHAEEFSQTSSGSMSLCVEVDDLDAMIAHLTNLGYPPPGDIIHASHGRELYAYDPDGNRLILHQS